MTQLAEHVPMIFTVLSAVKQQTSVMFLQNWIGLVRRVYFLFFLLSCADYQFPNLTISYEILLRHQETEKSKGIVSRGLPSYPVTLQPEDHFTHTVAVLIYNEPVWPQECEIPEKRSVDVWMGAIHDANVNKRVAKQWKKVQRLLRICVFMRLCLSPFICIWIHLCLTMLC